MLWGCLLMASPPIPDSRFFRSHITNCTIRTVPSLWKHFPTWRISGSYAWTTVTWTPTWLNPWWRLSKTMNHWLRSHSTPMILTHRALSSLNRCFTTRSVWPFSDCLTTWLVKVALRNLPDALKVSLASRKFHWSLTLSETQVWTPSARPSTTTPL